MSSYTKGEWGCKYSSRSDIFCKAKPSGFYGEGHIAMMSKYDESMADAALIIASVNAVQRLADSLGTNAIDVAGSLVVRDGCLCVEAKMKGKK